MDKYNNFVDSFFDKNSKERFNGLNMPSTQLIEQLQQLGLKDKEARVYLASLNLGPSTIQSIAARSGVKRTTVYPIIQTLEQQGLMHAVQQGFKRHYQAEHPDQLRFILEQKHRSLDQLLPQLTGMFHMHGENNLISYHYGLESIKTIYNGLIRDINPGEPYRIISDATPFFQQDPKFFHDFTRRRAKLNIDIKLILVDSPTAREQQKIQKQLNEEVRLLPPETKLSINMVVTPQKLLLQQMTEPIQAMVITNPLVISMMQEYFAVMWPTAKIPLAD